MEREDLDSEIVAVLSALQTRVEDLTRAQEQLRQEIVTLRAPAAELDVFAILAGSENPGEN